MYNIYMQIYFMPYLVESERHVTGYTHGLILNFGSVGSTDPDPKSRVRIWIRRVRIHLWSDPDPDPRFRIRPFADPNPDPDPKIGSGFVRSTTSSSNRPDTEFICLVTLGTPRFGSIRHPLPQHNRKRKRCWKEDGRQSRVVGWVVKLSNFVIHSDLFVPVLPSLCDKSLKRLRGSMSIS